MVTNTSLQAYQFIKGTLNHRQQVVLNALRSLGSSNNKLLANWLRLPINQITPRVLELRNMGYVGVDREGDCPITGRNTIWWKVTKYGELASEEIDDPRVALVEALPYIVEYGSESDRFTAQYKAKSQKQPYNTWLKVHPGGKMEFGCDCYDFVNTKQGLEPCKHCKSLRDNVRKNGHIEGTDYWKDLNG